MDEFAFHTISAKAGVLAVRALDDDALMSLARSNAFRAADGTAEPVVLRAYADVVAITGPGTNPTWVTMRAVETAYDRGLIDEVELDYLLDC